MVDLHQCTLGVAVLQVDESEHARIIHEATQVDKRLKGEVNDLQLEDDAKQAEDV